jgi:anhydro-N-acetylmuramic acid kinase
LSGSLETIYVGLMSGTSMDGVDALAVAFGPAGNRVLAEDFRAFDPALRDALFALQASGPDEIARESLAALALAHHYANAVTGVLRRAGATPAAVTAIGAHGQTIRHCPASGYTRQLNQPALLAELTGIDVVADFRARDIAAGGQGAPLAPAFHAVAFGRAGETRVVCNLGGISNISILRADGRVTGFDCGPANVLLDLWAQRHLGSSYDAQGRLASQGTINAALLETLLEEPFFGLPPPKSTGRDLFHAQWLDARLAGLGALAAADVQATLVELTAVSVAREIVRHAPDCGAVYVCGGGARNPVVMARLDAAMTRAGLTATLASTDALGVPPHQVEAYAFAWLAMRTITRQPGNLPAVTGAAGSRVLGAVYPR